MSAGSPSGTIATAIWCTVFVVVVVMIATPIVVMTGRTGGHARSDTCLYNLKECATALMIYGNSYNAGLPSSALVSGAKRWNRKDFVAFATRKGNTRSNLRPRTWFTALYQHLASSDRGFCPSDESDHSKPTSLVSYYWKTAIDMAWYGVGCSKPCRKRTDFACEQGQILLYERRGFHAGTLVLGLVRRKSKPLVNSVRINVVYLDTHVKNIAIRNATSGDPNNPAAAADGEPMYFNFDNAKPEGHGNPLPPGVPARYIDPRRYSDHLP